MESFTEAVTHKLRLQGSTCSFSIYLLSCYYVLNSILGAWDLSVRQTKIPALTELIFYKDGRTDNA